MLFFMEHWMRLVSKKEAARLTSLSVATIDRYVETGNFPQPVGVGKWVTRRDARTGKLKRYCTRIAFVEDEVLAWNRARIAKRDAKRNSAPHVEEHITT